MSLFPCDLI